MTANIPPAGGIRRNFLEEWVFDVGLEGWGELCRQRLGLLAQMVARTKATFVANVLGWVRISLGTVQGSGSYTWKTFYTFRFLGSTPRLSLSGLGNTHFYKAPCVNPMYRTVWRDGVWPDSAWPAAWGLGVCFIWWDIAERRHHLSQAPGKSV